MAQQQFAGIAAVVALTFLVLALASCASSAQIAAMPDAPAVVASDRSPRGTPEFHDAAIGADTLRSRLNVD